MDQLQAYHAVRKQSQRLAAPLSPEDQTVQSMPDASPTKWHLAHTTWFFETFVLVPFAPGYRTFHPDYEHLFNSYYNSVGQQFSRPHRGRISRPGVAEVAQYRAHVDASIERLVSGGTAPEVMRLLELGLHHEQQHQELLLTDIKHALFQNPTFPAYMATTESPDSGERPLGEPIRGEPPIDVQENGANGRPVGVPARAADERSVDGQAGSSGIEELGPGGSRFLDFSGGIALQGHEGEGFHFDNEGPRHRVILEDFSLARDLVTHRDVLAFIEAGGYHDPLLWLSDGWAWRSAHDIEHPYYYRPDGDGGFREFTLAGLVPLNLDAPAAHLSYFEADALARFLGARLPTEQEWEHASQTASLDHESPAAFLRHTGRAPHPRPPESVHTDPSPANHDELRQMFGCVWQWTSSPYCPYPGFRPAPGAVGEYNGKFMHNQMVLRGGSCVTPAGHVRRTYRNFFPSHARWQFAGLRLARSP